MKKYLITALSVFIVNLFASNAIAKEKLYLYGWSEYIPQEIIDNFEKETGIQVHYTTYDSNENMYTKLKVSSAEYDLIMPSSYFVSKMVSEDMLTEIDTSKISNYSNISKELLSKTSDQVNSFSVPYMWGTSGIAFDTTKYPDLAKTESISWAELIKPQYKNELLVLDDQLEMFAIALSHVGKPINSTKESEIKEAYNFLDQLKQNIKIYDSNWPESILLSGDATIAIIWNGEGFRATKSNKNIKFVFPKDKLAIWVDSFAIPKNAQNVENAYKFINFIISNQSMAKAVEEYGYTPANTNALKLLGDEYANNPIINISKELENHDYDIQKNVGSEAYKIYVKYWNMIKS